MFNVSDLLFSVPDTAQTIQEGALSCGWASCQQRGLSHLSCCSQLALPFFCASLIPWKPVQLDNPPRKTSSSPVSQSRIRAGRSEWPKTPLLPCRTWHLRAKDGSKQCSCLPFLSNVAELFQWWLYGGSSAIRDVHQYFVARVKVVAWPDFRRGWASGGHWVSYSYSDTIYSCSDILWYSYIHILILSLSKVGSIKIQTQTFLSGMKDNLKTSALAYYWWLGQQLKKN